MNTTSDLTSPFSVLIRVDASPSIGCGQVTRMTALASACRRSGAKVNFLSTGMPQTLQRKISDIGCHCQPMSLATGSAEDARLTAELAANGNFDWVVLDGYHFDDSYQEIVGQHSSRLMVVDDLGHASHRCAQLVLNQNAYAHRSRYNQQNSTDILCGVKYSLLRPEFNADPDGHRRNNQRFNIKRILVTFGGCDTDDWTLATLRTLLKLKLATTSQTVADVVVGVNYGHEKRLAQFCRDAGMNVFIHRNIDRMDALMHQADIAITAGDSTCYELARIGVPSIAIATVENQIPVITAMEQHGTLKGFCPEGSLPDRSHPAGLPTEIADTIGKLVRNREERQSMADSGRKLLDGQGAHRVVRKLHAGVINFYPATRDDSDLLLNLRKDPAIRAASFQTALMGDTEHQKWLAQSLASPGRTLWIARDRAQRPLGYIQLDLSENLQEATVEVALESRLRGKGLGPVLIEKAAAQILSDAGEFASVNKVIANIKPANTHSCKAFEKAGFEFSAPTTVNNEIALRYVLRPENTIALAPPATVRKSA